MQHISARVYSASRISRICAYDASVSEVLRLYGDDIRRILVQRNFQTVAEKEAFYTTNIVGVLSVCAVAIIAGLFLGYLTLDVIDLQVSVEIGDFINLNQGFLTDQTLYNDRQYMKMNDAMQPTVLLL